MAQENKITIKFKPEGDQKLINAINHLHVATKGLTGGTKEYERALKGLTLRQKKQIDSMVKLNHATRNTSGAFSTARSQMLLFSFAVGLGANTVGKFINVASDAEEIQNKFNVVFGKGATIVNQWAEALGESIGRTTQQLQQMASTLQDTFVPLGFTRAAATKLSTSLTELALDVASFNNQSDDEVLRAFQSALVGNHETVRKYGIVITEATLQQEALRSGIIDTDRELTNQEKVQARLNLLYAGSADAIGDLKNTQDSYANRLKAFNAQVIETQKALGEVLIPLATKMLEFASHLANTDTIKGYTTAITALSIGFVVLKRNVIFTAAAMTTFKVALARTGIGLAVVALGELATRFLFTSDKSEELTDSLDDLKKAIANLRAEYVTINHEVKTLSSQVKIQIALVKNQKEAFSLLINEEKFAEEQLKRLAEAQKIFNEEYARSPLISDEQREKVRRTRDVLASSLEILSKIKKVEFDPIPEKDLDETVKGAMLANRAISMVGDAMARLVMEGKSLSKLKLGDILGQMALSMAFTGLIGGGIGALFNKGFGASAFKAMGIAHTGGHITDDGKIQRFANGGVIHGEDNVPILAQSGEFVMSRNAVESVGLETMNRINQTGDAGGVTVNVSGNVMTQDFVENDLADAIREAARRGVAFS